MSAYSSLGCYLLILIDSADYWSQQLLEQSVDYSSWRTTKQATQTIDIPQTKELSKKNNRACSSLSALDQRTADSRAGNTFPNILRLAFTSSTVLISFQCYRKSTSTHIDNIGYYFNILLLKL